MIYLGDCISVMRGMDADIYDGIITDPPYASGGRTIGERRRSTAVKYTALKKEPRGRTPRGSEIRVHRKNKTMQKHRII